VAAADSYSEVGDVASLVSAATQVSNPGAVYAVVSRNRTAPSQTDPVRASTGAADSSAAAAGVADTVTVDARRDLYTRVVRRRDGTASGGRATSEPARVDLGGADGYASIDEPPAVALRQPAADNSVDFYDVIGDDLSVTASSDFDPNYESVPQTTAAAASVSTSASDSVGCVAPGSGSSATTGQRRQPDAAAATVSVVGTGRQNEPTTGRHGGFLVREHIYDEVSSPTARCSTTDTHSDV